jgi:hypothetical protein
MNGWWLFCTTRAGVSAHTEGSSAQCGRTAWCACQSHHNSLHAVTHDACRGDRWLHYTTWWPCTHSPLPVRQLCCSTGHYTHRHCSTAVGGTLASLPWRHDRASRAAASSAACRRDSCHGNSRPQADLITECPLLRLRLLLLLWRRLLQ